MKRKMIIEILFLLYSIRFLIIHIVYFVRQIELNSLLPEANDKKVFFKKLF